MDAEDSMSDDPSPKASAAADRAPGDPGDASDAPGPDDTGSAPTRRGAISDALLTAMTTDHFVMQTAASTTVNEAVGRSALYVSALSSSLVAIGFATSLPALLAPLISLVIPTVFVLGVFTVARLVETGVANIAYLAQIARLRQRYAAIDDEAASFFPAPGDPIGQAVGSLATGNSRFGPLFTAASTIAIINAIVGGVGVALLVRLGATQLTWLWIISGVIVFLLCMLVFLRYQQARAAASVQ